MNFIKNCFIIILALTIGSTASGQSLQRILSTGNQMMVEEAVAPAFSIVRQEFQLQDEQSGQKYNLDSLGYFGFSEAVCINLVDGIITSKVILRPWELDENVASYPEYKPVLSVMSEYNISNGSWTPLECPSFENAREIDNSEKVIIQDTLFTRKGLVVDTEGGQKDGWLFWVYREGNSLSFKSFRQKFVLNDTASMASIMQPEENDTPILGVLLSTDYSEVGVIRFKLAAIVERFAEGWKAISIVSNEPAAEEEHTLVAAPEIPVEPITPPSGKKVPWKKKK